MSIEEAGQLFGTISAIIADSETEMIEMQKNLCAIPAVSPNSGGSGEAAKAAWLIERLREWNFPEPEMYPAPCADVEGGERPNIIVRLKGESDEFTTWILTHLDVVPPGEQSMWSSDPWTVRADDGKLYGRGTEDNHQGIVSAVFAFKSLLDKGITPPHDIALAFVSDEETGSGFGADFLMKNHGDLFGQSDRLLIPDAGNEKGTMIEVAEKSIAWIEFTVKGKQTHGSTPDLGINAHKAGAHLIVMLEQLYVDFPARDDLFDPPVSTFEPTLKKANVENINTIPGVDVFAFDCRVLASYSLDEVRSTIGKYISEVERIFGVSVSIEFPTWQPAAPPTAPDAPIVKALQDGIRKVYGIDAEPMGIGGGTVAAFFRQAGIPAAVWSRMDDMAHQHNEYCVVENMIGDARVMAHLFLEV